MKPTKFGVALVIAALVVGVVSGREGASHETLEAVTRARVAEAKILDVTRELQTAQVSLRSLHRAADSIGQLRAVAATRARAASAARTVVPAGASDSTLLAALTEARDEADDALEALALAENEIAILQEHQDLSELTLTRVDTILVEAAPVVHEATKIPPSRPSLRSRLGSQLTPYVQLQYGAHATVVGGKVDVRLAPAVFIGWRIQVPLSKLFS